MKPFRFDPDALAEYQSAIRWYDEHSGVAAGFVTSIEQAITRVRAAPRSFARWRTIELQEVRRCVVRRFPFFVIYRVETDSVTILAVAHQRREPGYWVKRLSP